MTDHLSKKISVISFFSILLVVFLHAFNLNGNNENILFSHSAVWFAEDLICFGFTRIAVPVFFVLSGYLFFLNAKGSNAEFISKIKKRAKTLFIPFLFWSLFGIGFYFTLQSIPQFAVFFTKEHVADFSFREWLVKIFIVPVPYQFWFIRDLMLMVLLSPLWYYLLKKMSKPTLLVIFVVWIFITNQFQNSVEAMLFFLLGGCIAIHNPALIGRQYKNQSKFLITAWIILVFLKTILSSYDCNSVLTQVIFKSSILTGVAGFWGMYDVFTKDGQRDSKILTVTAYTFFIFAAHEPMLTIFKKILFSIIGKGQSGYIEIFLIAPALTIISCLLLAVILKRYLNAFYGIITGGR